MLRQRKICLRKRCLPSWRGHKASAAEADSCRRGVRLFAIIQQTATVVNNFLLYHRKTGAILTSKKHGFRENFLRVGQNLYPCLRQKQAGYTKYGRNGFSENFFEFQAKIPGISSKKILEREFQGKNRKIRGPGPSGWRNASGGRRYRQSTPDRQSPCRIKQRRAPAARE